MALLRRYHSFDNLDDGFFAMKNLLDSVERNQRSGIYLRSCRSPSIHDDFKVSVHPFASNQSYQYDGWESARNPLKAEKLLATDPRQSAPISVHRNFVSRTRSLSPTQHVTIRLLSESTSSVPRHFPPTDGIREAHRFHNHHILSYDPFCSSQHRLQHLLESRQIAEKDIQRKIAESRRDLATLKKLISETFGGNDYCDSYHSSNIGFGRSEYLTGVEQNDVGYKLDPEALLDTVERRRRHSLPHVHHYEYFTPVVYTKLEPTPTTYDRSRQTLETFTKPRIEDDSIVVRISGNTPRATDYGPSFYQKPQMPFLGHLGYPPLRPIGKYLFEPPRIQANYQHYVSPTSTSLYNYNDDSSLHFCGSLVPSLDMAKTRSFRLRPETSYFTVDKRRHNQLVRHNLPGLYQNSRSYSVFPQRKLAVFAGHTFSPRYHYEVRRSVTRPTHYSGDLSGLMDEEKMRLEKYESKSIHPSTDHYRPHKSYHYDFDNEPIQIDRLNDNDDVLHHSYSRQYVNAPRVYDTLRRRSTRPAFSHHVRTRSLPPMYRWQPENFVGTTFPLTPTRAESINPSGNLETLDKVMKELDESEDSHRFYGYNNHNFPHYTNVDSYLRPSNSYLFYRQIYKKNLSKQPQENHNYYSNYLNESPSIYVSNRDDNKAPRSNTVYQDGRFFDHQLGMNSEILTPPTRVTKPESYLRRSASGEYARIISKQDFDPRYVFQRYSVV